MNFSIKDIMFFVFIASIIFGLSIRLGWYAGGWIVGFFFVFLVPLALCVVFTAKLFYLGLLKRPIMNCSLLCMSLFCWPSLIFGVFTTESIRGRLLATSLTIGSVIGIVIGIHSTLALKKFKISNKIHTPPNSVRLNVGLIASLSAVLVMWKMSFWLIWDIGQSVGLEVSTDKSGFSSIEFYGRAVSPRTVQIALTKKLAPGSIEKVDVLGIRFIRGHLPYYDDDSNVTFKVRSLKFHHTIIDDSVIQALNKFTDLHFLDLRGTRVSDAGVRELQSMLPRCKITR